MILKSATWLPRGYALSAAWLPADRCLNVTAPPTPCKQWRSLTIRNPLMRLTVIWQAVAAFLSGDEGTKSGEDGTKAASGRDEEEREEEAYEPL